MATTPTYSWPIPDDTDLVKNGAEAIRDLGNAIDTTVGTTGLVHIKTVDTGGNVSSIDITNCFTADYYQYRVTIDLIGSGATEREINLRYLLGTTPNTATQYRVQALAAGGTTVVGARSTGQTSHSVGRCFNTTKVATQIEIFFPFQSERTQIINSRMLTPSGNLEISVQNFSLDVTTSYDGFQLLPSADQFNGTVTVLGYKK
jgi:hypothetical protein